MSDDNILPILQLNKKPTLLIRVWHRVQERIRHPRIREFIARAISKIYPKARVSESKHLNNLRSIGIAHFPGFLTDQEVKDLLALLESLPCFDPWAQHLGEFDCLHIPARTHVAQIKLAPSLVKLHELAHDKRLVDLAAGYFGCRPYLDSIQAWWSVSGHNQAEEAENFHRDNDSIRFLKFFIYLTDVGCKNGPHVFVEGSHISDKLLDRRRLSDFEVEKSFGPQVLSITGRAGDAFMEDTYGIHKGQLPEEGRRLLVQFRYSVTETVFRSKVIVARARQFKDSSIVSLING